MSLIAARCTTNVLSCSFYRRVKRKSLPYIFTFLPTHNMKGVLLLHLRLITSTYVLSWSLYRNSKLKGPSFIFTSPLTSCGNGDVNIYNGSLIQDVALTSLILPVKCPILLPAPSIIPLLLCKIRPEKANQ